MCTRGRSVDSINAVHVVWGLKDESLSGSVTCKKDIRIMLVARSTASIESTQ